MELTEYVRMGAMLLRGEIHHAGNAGINPEVMH
jgi:hypothetical protein